VSRNRLRVCVPLGALAALCASSAIAQPVQGRIESLGFQARGQARYVVRRGQWFPVLLTLRVPGDQHFSGSVRIECSDLDGDRVAYTERPVTVTANAERRAWCYAVVARYAADPLRADIVSDDGVLIQQLDAPLFEPISNDTQLILDVSDEAVPLVAALDTSPVSYSEWTWGQRRFYRNVCVANLRARDLPDRWFGLEAVDLLVWDEPNPDAVSEAQLRALIEWVRNGGQLVVGLGPAWTRVAKSPLAEILPLSGDAPTVEVRELPLFRGRYATEQAVENSPPIVVATAGPASGAQVTLRERLPDGGRLNFITMRQVGAGRVMACAARLRDLGAAGAVKPEFLPELFDVHVNTAEFLKREADQAMALSFKGPAPLYNGIVELTEFRAGAGLLVGLAFVFIVGYGVVAVGSWWWLQRRSLAHLSWPVFAGFAVAGSALSLGGVWLKRGILDVVHTFSFVDLEAGSPQATAFTYFGYRSSTRKQVDLSLPGDGGFLRPLAGSFAQPATPYATPERYSALTARAALDQTLVRATLKQFEGFWRGTLDGTLHGQLTANRTSGQITPDSWLQNDLNVALLGGYLLYIDPRLEGGDGVPQRAAGLTRRTDRSDYWDHKQMPPAANVLVIQVPGLRPGEKVSGAGGLGRPEYGRYEREYPAWSSKPNPAKRDEPMLPTLWSVQNEQWIAAFSLMGAMARGVDQSWDAAALASTRNLYLHNGGGQDFTAVGTPITTDGLADLDVTHWLAGGPRQGQAVLLLIADDPGPAVLQAAGKPISRRSGRTLYRVRIPLTYAGLPPRGSGP